MSSLTERHHAFQELHQSGCFVIPNPWDAGSAKLFAAHGAKALATSSAAHAFALGLPDMGHVTRDQAITMPQRLLRPLPCLSVVIWKTAMATIPKTSLRQLGSHMKQGCQAAPLRTPK